MLERLGTRARWLSDHVEEPTAADTLDDQLVHGDFQDSNLFFDGGGVSSVIDGDKA